MRRLSHASHPGCGWSVADRHAEDVHTGLDVISHGWSLKYVPVNLATGASPDSVDAFAYQQYRCCLGSTTPLRRLRTVPMSRRARAAYLSGFLYYLFTALLLFVVPVIAIGTLVFIPRTSTSRTT